MTTKTERAPRWIWWAGIALLAGGMAVGAALYAFLGAREPDSVATSAETEGVGGHAAEAEGVVQIPGRAQQESGIEVVKATLRPFRDSLSVTGTVGPDQTRIAHVRPLARGVVDEVFVQFGSQVAKTQPLLSYDNVELGLAVGEYLSALSGLRASQTDLQMKEKILDRSAEMLRVGALARTTHDVREAEYQSAVASVDNSKSNVAKFEEQLHRFGLSDSDIAKLGEDGQAGYHRTASHTTIRAPSPGVITAYNVSTGETVDPSSELLTITDISTVWVLADVYERNLGSVKLGSKVSIRVPSYPGEVFEGRITYIGDVIEQETRTARVRCVVNNPGKRLKLDMFATVEIPTETTAQGVSVPTAAIQQIENQPVVFVQRSETEFEQRPVTLGLEAKGWTQVLQGVKEGEAVIGEGSFYAKTAALRELIGDEH